MQVPTTKLYLALEPVRWYTVPPDVDAMTLWLNLSSCPNPQLLVIVIIRWSQQHIYSTRSSMLPPSKPVSIDTNHSVRHTCYYWASGNTNGSYFHLPQILAMYICSRNDHRFLQQPVTIICFLGSSTPSISYSLLERVTSAKLVRLSWTLIVTNQM